MSHVSLGRPEFVPGTPPGHPTAKFLYVIFLCRFFSLHIQHTFRPMHGNHCLVETQQISLQVRLTKLRVPEKKKKINVKN